MSHRVFRLFRRDVSRCFLLSEAFSIQFQWIFLSKNSLKPLELTFLTSIYRQVFKPIKKLMLSCLIEYSDFFVRMFRDVSCYLKRSRYNFNDFFNQKFIETTRTDISNKHLSSRFKSINPFLLVSK